ncbi:hypothetical protein H7U19_12870 [Hyunsoonleella sp. SJ7]|uniref:Uncharacterized protein n=1 Tax=Hyunsoonleella aquatilis TaxID=2762758 RepID=A0A923HA46_9FLAO|nr:hypothetical protein [Hyunsoonleella aquatilis]MBC3759303.1 hypothetical protein [Hyunsoonleella aquatilis]
MNVRETEKQFVKNFIRKEKRERSLWALNHKKKRTDFIDRFNHSWNEMIAEKDLTELNTKSDCDTYEKIKSDLKLKDSDLCYVVSYNEFDKQFVELKSAFEECQKSTFAVLMISKDGKKFYLKTEQEIGSPAKFIGIK